MVDQYADVLALDAQDPLRDKRRAFHVPEGLRYLDGNSLGLLPLAVKHRIADVVAKEWGDSLIRAWNSHNWMDLPMTVGNKIGRLVGAEKDALVCADSTSINVAKALSAALALNPGRKTILTDSGNFPTDIYMAEGLTNLLGNGHTVKIVAPEEVHDAIDETIAVLMLTQVDYRTGRRHDMQSLTRRAHAHGVLAFWDLAHSAGAFEVDLAGCEVDLAVGCSYKYLNGGPGAPAFIYVNPKHHEVLQPMLSGWIGHAEPFAFKLGYQPAEGVQRMNVGTPPVLALSALDTALDIWADVDMALVRQKSIALSELFVHEVEARCAAFGLQLASPREADARGSQISFHCPNGYAVMQALIANNVIGDFRAPDIIRFGFTPLYLSFDDVFQAAVTLERVLTEKLWDNPKFLKKEKVT